LKFFIDAIMQESQRGSRLWNKRGLMIESLVGGWQFGTLTGNSKSAGARKVSIV
jgi:hypothetical protein